MATPVTPNLFLSSIQVIIGAGEVPRDAHGNPMLKDPIKRMWQEARVVASEPQAADLWSGMG